MSQALRRCSASLLRASTRAPLLSLRTTVSLGQARIPLSHFTLRTNVAAFHQGRTLLSEQVAAAAATHSSPPPSTSANTESSEPLTKFAELGEQGILHANIAKTITDHMGLHTMTEVQTKTINEALKGVDMIAKAKTGTGKTLAFLVPILQNIIKENPSLAIKSRHRADPNDTRAIIISPTRELAEQIAEEARKLVSRTNVIVQTAVGGTQKRAALSKMQYQGCHILVATPGRLNDLLSDEWSGISAPKLNTLVLDEADRLLDTGFAQELASIMQMLPKPEQKERQTLMFSATVPDEVVTLVRRTLKPGFRYVNCVGRDDQPTHERVPQKVVHVNGLENTMPALYELCEKQIREARTSGGRPFKAVVFFNATSEVSLASQLFRNLSHSPAGAGAFQGTKIFDIYGKLTQAARTAAADGFRRADSAILLSSDVTARGMDFPNVTHVIQVGLPRARDDYVHRIGRTGRAGKEGEGWLIVSPLDQQQTKRLLRDIPLQKDTSLETANIDMTQAAQIPASAARVLTTVNDAFKRTHYGEKAKAYMALLSVFGRYPDKHDVVEAVNNLAKFGWGLPEAPSLTPQSAAKMGYNSRHGLNMKSSDERSRDDFFSPRRNDSFSSRRRSEDDDPFAENNDAFGADQSRSTRSRSGFRSPPPRRDARSNDFSSRQQGRSNVRQRMSRF